MTQRAFPGFRSTGRPTPSSSFTALERVRGAPRQVGQVKAAGASLELQPQIVGTLADMKIRGDWAAATVWAEDGKRHSVSGNAVKELKEGLQYEFLGKFSVHPKYGPQLQVSAAFPRIAPNHNAIVRFITASFDGIGEKSATKFVAKVIQEGGAKGLEELRCKLLKEPWSISFDEVIGRKGTFSDEHRDTSIAAFIKRDLSTRIAGMDGVTTPSIKALSVYLASRITAADPNATDVVDKAWRMLSADPYKPIMDVRGYGFVAADSIGRHVGIAHDAPVRLAALVAHAVHQHCDVGGHAFLTAEQLYASVGKIDPRIQPEDAVPHAVQRKTIQVDSAMQDEEDTDGEDLFVPPETRYYKHGLLRAETKLAAKIAGMLQPSDPILKGSNPDPEALGGKAVLDLVRAAARRVFPDGLDPTQEEALRRIITSPVRVHTLTAGPGCGKTALMEVLVKMLPQCSFRFCAPTGKAAKVLSNRLASAGLEASTIHSMLKGSDPGDFAVGDNNPLTGDILVVDESSMPDLALANALFSAVPERMHVILLGDTRQLPSIKPGSVLSDLLKIEEIDHNHLSVTHRNSGGILEVVNEIGEGAVDVRDRDAVRFSQGLGEASQRFQEVMTTYLDAVQRRGVANVMLMMPRRKGRHDEPGWDTTYANATLRQVCNPAGQAVPGTFFRVHDRIVIRENMGIPQPDADEVHGGKARRDDPAVSVPEERVVNGDTGSILGYVLDPKARAGETAKWISLQLDDGRRVQFPGESASSLDLAYAMTVHASQGSEYKEVVMVVTPGTATFMNRNMLFTGVSRARESLHVFGEEAVIKRVARTPLPERNSALADRIRHAVDATAADRQQASQARRGEREQARQVG